MIEQEWAELCKNGQNCAIMGRNVQEWEGLSKSGSD